MRPTGARAIPREDGQMSVYSSTQSPSAAQKHVAGVLGIPMHKVEVDVKRLGGGFGGKEDPGDALGLYGCLCSKASQCACPDRSESCRRHEDDR